MSQLPLSLKLSNSTTVAENLAERLPYSIFLLGTSTAIGIAIGILLGCIAARRRGKFFDTFSAIFSIVFPSLPVWWLGMILITMFSSSLHWFPLEGWRPPIWAAQMPVVWTVDISHSANTIVTIIGFNIQELITLVGGYLEYAFLPICALFLSSFGTWVLITRASLLEVIGEEYLTTARAKGIAEWRIITKHALRNACLPIVTNAALSFSSITTGSIMVETVFRYPGVGFWLYNAIILRDYVVLMTVFYVFSLWDIIANAVADFLYGLFDPRVRRP